MPLTARDVMTSPVTTVTPSTPLVELARILTDDQISGAPVVDIESRLVGIVSKTDLLERLIDEATEFTSNPSFQKLFNLIEDEDSPDSSSGEQGLDWMPEMAEASDTENLGNVEDIMQPEVVTVAPNAPVSSLAALMSRNRIHRVIVVDDGRVVGIVTSLDLLSRFPADAGASKAAPLAPKRHAISSARKPRPASVRRPRPEKPRRKPKAVAKSKPRKKKSTSRH